MKIIKLNKRFFIVFSLILTITSGVVFYKFIFSAKTDKNKEIKLSNKPIETYKEVRIRSEEMSHRGCSVKLEKFLIYLDKEDTFIILNVLLKFPNDKVKDIVAKKKGKIRGEIYSILERNLSNLGDINEKKDFISLIKEKLDSDLKDLKVNKIEINFEKFDLKDRRIGYGFFNGGIGYVKHNRFKYCIKPG